MQEIIQILTQKAQTISTMESCTGGAIVNAITNIEGASEVLKFSAVTYSNDYKIKMGVDANIINQYTVYSQQTAKAMAKTISDYTNSDYGLGITGKLNRRDRYNQHGRDNEVFISIYDRNNDTYHNFTYLANKESRLENKNEIINLVTSRLLNIIKL